MKVLPPRLFYHAAFYRVTALASVLAFLRWASLRRMLSTAASGSCNRWSDAYQAESEGGPLIPLGVFRLAYDFEQIVQRSR